MNKIITVALIAGGLLLLDSPEAAAHKQVRNVHAVHAPAAYYRVEHRRARHMPYWLKRDKAFRRWYKRTHLRKYRRMTWHRLYDVYLWERFDSRRRGDRFYFDHDHRGPAQRHDYRDNRGHDDHRRGERRRDRH